MFAITKVTVMEIVLMGSSKVEVVHFNRKFTITGFILTGVGIKVGDKTDLLSPKFRQERPSPNSKRTVNSFVADIFVILIFLCRYYQLDNFCKQDSL